MKNEKIKQIINEGMNKLREEDSHSYEILYELYFKDTSIYMLSKKLGISRRAVRYRRDKAIKQLKRLILKSKRKIEQNKF